MKKCLCIILALLFLVSLGSCNKDKDTNDPTPPPTYEIKKHTEDVNFNEKDYGNITLLYPELEGLGNVNELLFNAVSKKCADSLPNLSSYDASEMPEVTYEIMSVSITYLSATFLSARVEGTLTVSLAPHPEPFVYTLQCVNKGLGMRCETDRQRSLDPCRKKGCGKIGDRYRHYLVCHLGHLACIIRRKIWERVGAFF